MEFCHICTRQHFGPRWLFFSAAFRGAVKSSSESYSAWETALTRLRNRGPWQVLEPTEEQLVISAQRNSKFTTISGSMDALSLWAIQYLLALGCVITVKKGGNPLRRGQEMLFLWRAAKHAQADSCGRHRQQATGRRRQPAPHMGVQKLQDIPGWSHSTALKPAHGEWENAKKHRDGLESLQGGGKQLLMGQRSLCRACCNSGSHDITAMQWEDSVSIRCPFLTSCSTCCLAGNVEERGMVDKGRTVTSSPKAQLRVLTHVPLLRPSHATCPIIWLQNQKWVNIPVTIAPCCKTGWPGWPKSKTLNASLGLKVWLSLRKAYGS